MDRLPVAQLEHPCLSLLKRSFISDIPRVRKCGDVRMILDPLIGKRAYSIRGDIAASNFIEIPKFLPQPLMFLLCLLIFLSLSGS